MTAQAGPLAQLVEWKPRQGSLRGFCRVRFASGIEIAEIQVHVAGSRRWAAPPGRPWIADKTVVTDPATSKVRYQTLIFFSSHGVCSRWSNAVLNALRAAYPDVLAAEDVA